jgi:8-oxo-dGTP pyrophosphatase MutT (NUDIX family)
LVNTINKFEQHLVDPAKLYDLISSKLNNHTIRTFRYADVPYKKAAVAIPVFFKDGAAHMLFTKRTDTVEHHKGQISFPGGMHDCGDDDLEQTALRETWEEMGIKPDDLSVLGRTDNFLTNTNFMVTPFVTSFPYPYDYKINPDEIVSILEVPVQHLLNDKIFKIKKWERDGYLWDVHFYDYFGENIWGVTGFLLSNFLSIVFDLPRMNLA